MQVPFLLVGGICINDLWFGWTSNLIAFVVLALFFPLWVCSQNESCRVKSSRAKVDENAEVN